MNSSRRDNKFHLCHGEKKRITNNMVMFLNELCPKEDWWSRNTTTTKRHQEKQYKNEWVPQLLKAFKQFYKGCLYTKLHIEKTIKVIIKTIMREDLYIGVYKKIFNSNMQCFRHCRTKSLLKDYKMIIVLISSSFIIFHITESVQWIYDVRKSIILFYLV